MLPTVSRVCSMSSSCSLGSRCRPCLPVRASTVEALRRGPIMRVERSYVRVRSPHTETHTRSTTLAHVCVRKDVVK